MIGGLWNDRVHNAAQALLHFFDTGELEPFYAASITQPTAVLTALRRPTLSPLADPEWVALETILDERTVRDIIPQLKRAGAEGIVEYSLNKLVY